MKLNFNFESRENHFLTSGISQPVLQYLLNLLHEGKENIFYAHLQLGHENPLTMESLIKK